MPLSWNEIKSRALGFSREWQNESSEDAEAKSFWDGFFNIFDIHQQFTPLLPTASSSTGRKTRKMRPQGENA